MELNLMLSIRLKVGKVKRELHLLLLPLKKSKRPKFKENIGFIE
jgi:hypothetical protein